MYEIQVHEDGVTEIRKVPSAFRGSGANLLVATYDEAASELGRYGIEDDRISEALEAAENDWEWVTV